MSVRQSTIQAFRKMRRRGIPVPPLRITDIMSQFIGGLFLKTLNQIEEEIREAIKDYDIRSGVLVKDSIIDLITSLSKKNPELLTRVINNVMFNMKSPEGALDYQKLITKIRSAINLGVGHFFQEFYEDADDKLIKMLTIFRLNKTDVFEQRLDVIKNLYLDDAVKRIVGEQNDLKAQFLQKLTDWVSGKEEKLNVSELVSKMKRTAVNEARFFARDQFCKLNKAVLIASFKTAGVKTVRLITCHDGAVRPTHRAWHNKVFAIDNIPIEWFKDYNCRCSAVPASY